MNLESKMLTEIIHSGNGGDVTHTLLINFTKVMNTCLNIIDYLDKHSQYKKFNAWCYAVIMLMFSLILIVLFLKPNYTGVLVLLVLIALLLVHGIVKTRQSAMEIEETVDEFIHKCKKLHDAILKDVKYVPKYDRYSICDSRNYTLLVKARKDLYRLSTDDYRTFCYIKLVEVAKLIILRQRNLDKYSNTDETKRLKDIFKKYHTLMLEFDFVDRKSGYEMFYKAAEEELQKEKDDYDESLVHSS
jgi:hypothetical protein